MLSTIAVILFEGLSFATLLFLISVGLSITLGMMGIVNLAHGAFAMGGGYFAVYAMTEFGLPFLVALLGGSVAVGLLSIPSEILIYRRLYHRPELDQVLASLGLVFMSIAAVTYVFGSTPVTIAIPEYLQARIDLGIIDVQAYRLFLIVSGLVILTLLWLGLERTLIGAKIRAAVDNRRMAQTVGVKVNLLFVLTFALGSGLAALGGGLAIQVIGMSPVFPTQYLVFFLIIVIVGGMGSLRGAFLASVILGVLDTAGKFLWPDGGDFFIYALTVVILLIAPQGLFGRRA